MSGWRLAAPACGYPSRERFLTELTLDPPDATSDQAGVPLYAYRTRFIPDGLLGLFERTAWPMGAPGSAVRSASEGVRVDVGARMRGMWR
jgi:hypothetical protein